MDVLVNEESVVDEEGIANITVPTKTSELVNDSNLVEDENYVHTDNNYTDEEKEKLADLENYDDTEILQELENKVEKIDGKGLSSNDFTSEEKEKLDSLENYDDTEIRGLITINANNITSETNNRETADNNLQSQIDAITSSSDVVDVVGTYAELQAYDTTYLKDNDIIKVLVDETKQNAITYYRWNDTTETFSFVGSQGPFYTKSESENKFVEKETGKGLSTNDYTTAEKNKLAELENYDDTTIIGRITSLESNKEDKTNKVTSISSSSRDDQYPSAKCVYDIVGNVESLLSNLYNGGGAV